MKANYPIRIDEVNGIVYAWFTRMEYRGGAVTSEVQKRETYLWFENDELVGSIRIYHNKEENCYEVERVMVAPQSQGKGYGKKLLSFVVAKLQQTQRTPIVLTVAACNDKAVKMYEKFGFVPVSEEIDEWKIEGDICG